MDTNRKLIFAVLCIVAAFILVWTGKEGGIAFLTLIGGSPIGNHLYDSFAGAPPQTAILASTAENGDKGSNA